MPEDCAERVVRRAQRDGYQHAFEQVNDPQNLITVFTKPVDYLISFKTSLIVKAYMLKRVRGYAINIHGGTPHFPGRDPHHFALYNGAKIFGSTAHFMTELVDSGPIINVKTFGVKPHFGPEDLMVEAEKTGWDLLESCVDDLFLGKTFYPHKGWSWSKKKHTRKEYLQLCTLTPEMSRSEMIQRVKACEVRGHSNLKIKIGNVVYGLSRELYP
jgi:methionyl-tRNA formyltransferase